MPISIIGQGITVTAASDTVNRIIDNIAKLYYFSNCKSSPYREMAEDQ